MPTRWTGRQSFRDATFHKPYVAIQVTAAALTAAAATAQTFDGPAIPAGSHIDEVIVRIDTPPTSSSGNTTNIGVIVGRSGATNELLTTANLFGTSAGTFSVLGGKGAAFNQGSAPAQAGYTPRVTVTPAGAGSQDLDDIDACDFTVFVFYTTAPTYGES